jgi:hypothetical protein
MLGTFQMDIDSCIRKYKAMSPEIFPMEYLSGSQVSKFVNTMTGTPRFDPAPLERAIKRLVVDTSETGFPQAQKEQSHRSLRNAARAHKMLEVLPSGSVRTVGLGRAHDKQQHQ